MMMGLNKRRLTQAGEISVTNSNFWHELITRQTPGTFGLQNVAEGIVMWTTNMQDGLAKRIISAEEKLRSIIEGQSILIQVLGPIGGGKSTLVYFLGKSLGAKVGDAYSVNDETGEYVLDGKKRATVPGKVALLFELPENKDIFPEGVTWNGLDGAKDRSKQTLKDLYTPDEEFLRAVKAHLRIQEAYLGGCRIEQLRFVVYMENELKIKTVTITDGGGLSDLEVFTRKYFTDGFLTEDDVQLVERHYQTARSIRVPDLYVLCSSPIEECIFRIQARNRDGESGISEEYLRGLKVNLDKLPDIIQKEGVPFVEIPISNYIKDPIEYLTVAETITPELEKISKKKRRASASEISTEST